MGNPVEDIYNSSEGLVYCEPLPYLATMLDELLAKLSAMALDLLPDYNSDIDQPVLADHRFS